MWFGRRSFELDIGEGDSPPHGPLEPKGSGRPFHHKENIHMFRELGTRYLKLSSLPENVDKLFSISSFPIYRWAGNTTYKLQTDRGNCEIFVQMQQTWLSGVTKIDAGCFRAGDVVHRVENERTFTHQSYCLPTFESIIASWISRVSEHIVPSRVVDRRISSRSDAKDAIRSNSLHTLVLIQFFCLWCLVRSWYNACRVFSRSAHAGILSRPPQLS